MAASSERWPRRVVERATTAVRAAAVTRAVEKSPHLERVVTINRVAKVVKGGRRFSFTALVVVGDGNGTVGVGYGKAKEVPAAIAKGVEEAKKHFFKVPRIGAPSRTRCRVRRPPVSCCSTPAAAGTGVIAGGPVRAVLECAGIHDVLSQVARLVQPDQHRARHGGGPEGACESPGGRRGPSWACRSRTSAPAAHARRARAGRGGAADGHRAEGHPDPGPPSARKQNQRGTRCVRLGLEADQSTWWSRRTAPRSGA